MVLLDLLKGTYYSLNEPASRLWALLSEGTSVQVAVEQVCGEFDAPVETIRTDLSRVLDTLRRAELVTDVPA
jgi:hypothetical protein